MSEKEKIVSVLLSGEFIRILGNMYIKFHFIIFFNLIPVAERFSFSSFRERMCDLPKFGGNCEA